YDLLAPVLWRFAGQRQGQSQEINLEASSATDHARLLDVVQERGLRDVERDERSRPKALEALFSREQCLLDAPCPQGEARYPELKPVVHQAASDIPQGAVEEQQFLLPPDDECRLDLVLFPRTAARRKDRRGPELPGEPLVGGEGVPDGR